MQHTEAEAPVHSLMFSGGGGCVHQVWVDAHANVHLPKAAPKSNGTQEARKIYNDEVSYKSTFARTVVQRSPR